MNVEAWLEELEMTEYIELFHGEGYRTSDDVENLKTLSEEDLRAMGISKRGK